MINTSVIFALMPTLYVYALPTETIFKNYILGTILIKFYMIENIKSRKGGKKIFVCILEATNWFNGCLPRILL